MRLTETVRQLLTKWLPIEFDPFMAAHGFRRSPDSLEYVRYVEVGTQTVDLLFDVAPTYAPGAQAHLLPQIRIDYPVLNRRVTEILRDDTRNLVGSTAITFSLQLQNAGPREARTGDATRWFVFDLESARQCIIALRSFAVEWTIPYLDNYSTIAAITAGYEARDERLPNDRRFYFFVVAAYTVLGEYAKAMHVLESVFGKARSRRLYAKAFEYMSSLDIK